MHITDVARKRWLQERIESAQGRFGVSTQLKMQLLKRLTDAETLEKFLHTRHVGQKRFSLEGGESLIPLLDQVIARCARHGAKEIVMGMAHRGRINVLANIMGRPLESLYEEPANGDADSPLSGDVKYTRAFPPIFPRHTDRCTWRWRSTPRISRSCIRWCAARCARARTGAATCSATKWCR